MDSNWNFKVEKGEIGHTVLTKAELKKILDDKGPKFDNSIANNV